MTHLPYIVASYGLVLGSALILSVQAFLRLKKAEKRTKLAESRRVRVATGAAS
ncbi:hypothetical protein ABUE34_09445 [Kozakia baliensis]|uniref:hypothetical protein n=1 Tax=Kozakia baliensis TaxID=153496 RepID=UPI00345B77AF